MDWRDYLKREERVRLAEIEAIRDDLTAEYKRITAEYRRIYDCCTKRSQRQLGCVEMRTSRGDCFLIDPSDEVMVAAHRWHSVANQNGRRPYVAAKIEGRRIYLHRFLTGATKGMVVDHIDGDTLNNSRSNLRVVTQTENMRSSVNRRATLAL